MPELSSNCNGIPVSLSGSVGVGPDQRPNGQWEPVFPYQSDYRGGRQQWIHGYRVPRTKNKKNFSLRGDKNAIMAAVPAAQVVEISPALPPRHDEAPRNRAGATLLPGSIESPELPNRPALRRLTQATWLGERSPVSGRVTRRQERTLYPPLPSLYSFLCLVFALQRKRGADVILSPARPYAKTTALP